MLSVLGTLLASTSAKLADVTTGHVLQEAMHDDPVVRYLVKKTSYRRFWDVMISHYLTPTHSELNFITEGCKAGMLARIYPDEQVMATKSLESGDAVRLSNAPMFYGSPKSVPSLDRACTLLLQPRYLLGLSSESHYWA